MLAALPLGPHLRQREVCHRGVVTDAEREKDRAIRLLLGHSPEAIPLLRMMHRFRALNGSETQRKGSASAMKGSENWRQVFTHPAAVPSRLELVAGDGQADRRGDAPPGPQPVEVAARRRVQPCSRVEGHMRSGTLVHVFRDNMCHQGRWFCQPLLR